MREQVDLTSHLLIPHTEPFTYADPNQRPAYSVHYVTQVRADRGSQGMNQPGIQSNTVHVYYVNADGPDGIPAAIAKDRADLEKALDQPGHTPETLEKLRSQLKSMVSLETMSQQPLCRKEADPGLLQLATQQMERPITNGNTLYLSAISRHHIL